MSLRKDSGIVLQSKVFSDSDVIFTLLGESQPKSRYIVKGIKKSKRRPIVACEQGSYIQLDYYFHINRDMYNIKELTVVNRFENAKQNYCGFLLIAYLCDLIQAFYPDGDVYHKSFKILYLALNYLNSGQYRPVLIPFFKIRILEEIGLISRELICHSCNRPFTELESCHLEAWNFEIICSDCNTISHNSKPILALLSELFYKNYKTLLADKIPISLLIELDRVLNLYIQAYLNRTIKSHSLLYKELGNHYEVYA